jgi:hypothetical protein
MTCADALSMLVAAVAVVQQDASLLRWCSCWRMTYADALSMLVAAVAVVQQVASLLRWCSC